tara:strand:- start:29 stop:253 length:225 start_codon:yes stop_codon:yes gene_type:complete
MTKNIFISFFIIFSFSCFAKSKPVDLHNTEKYKEYYLEAVDKCKKKPISILCNYLDYYKKEGDKIHQKIKKEAP